MLKHDMFVHIQKKYEESIEILIEHRKTCSNCINRQKCDYVVDFDEMVDYVMEFFDEVGFEIE